jgi:uncharacterized membrane protein YjdF
MMKWNKVWLSVTAVILIGLEFYSLRTDSHYKWDFIFLMLLLFGVYLARDKLNLSSFHYFLFCVFLVFHNLGTFGLYSSYFYGLEYDLYIHGFFGIVSSLILYRAYGSIGNYKSKTIIIFAVIVVVLGLSAFHELFEYAGAMTVGEGEGVLFMGAGDIDEWDTQKDMRNNLVGAILGLGGYLIYEKLKPSKKASKAKKKVI